LNSDGNFNSNLDLNIGAVVQIKEENGVSYVITLQKPSIFVNMINMSSTDNNYMFDILLRYLM
jgi:hypothetical protein